MRIELWVWNWFKIFKLKLPTSSTTNKIITEIVNVE